MNARRFITFRSIGLAVILTLASLVLVSAHGASAASGNLLTNADMEGGTTGWSVFGAGTVASNTSVVHGGTRSLSSTGRTASWNGPGQSVTSLLTNGGSFTTSVWMRTQSGTPTGKVTLQVTANGTTNYLALAQGAVNASGWTQLTGTATVSWSGTLSSATFYVETAAGTDSFYIDDASFVNNSTGGGRAPFRRPTAGHRRARSRTRSRVGSRSRTSPTSSSTAGTSSTGPRTTRDRRGAR